MVSIELKSTNERMWIEYFDDRVIHAKFEKLTKVTVTGNLEKFREIHNDFERKYNDEKQHRILRKL